MAMEVVNMILAPVKLSVDRMYIVGSYAQGKQNEWSDLDILIQLKGGRLYPTWKEKLAIDKQLQLPRLHLIYGTLQAQESLFKKHGDKYKYKEIPLPKEIVC
jgi:predicted nucleotidyltransferase